MTVNPGLPGDLKSSHTTAADGNVFADLGFPPQEAKALLANADARCPAWSLGAVDENRPASTVQGPDANVRQRS